MHIFFGLLFNEGISAASFCCQVAAWFPYIFWNFYSVKNHKIANNSTTAKAREKISTNLELFKFWIKIYVCLTKFKNNQILLNKISHIFLLTTKQWTGQKKLIWWTQILHSLSSISFLELSWMYGRDALPLNLV